MFLFFDYGCGVLNVERERGIAEEIDAKLRLFPDKKLSLFIREQ